MSNFSIDGKTLKEILEYGYNNINSNKQIINDLNVFPIPDGDTGDNMCMTLGGGIQGIAGSDETSLGKIAKLCSDGMLLSARGNSGVILSQLFYGFANEIQDVDKATLSDIVRAFASGVRYGYKAVDKPTEGTMLTVAREATEHMQTLDLNNITIDNFVLELLNATNTSVQNTPDKLKTLKDAGVVDSGGAGIYYIIEGCSKYLRGEIITDESMVVTPQINEINSSKFNENSVLEYGYCSEVLLQLQKSKIDIDKFDLQQLKDYLNSIGDSIVAVQTGYVIKVHVHTFQPYKLLEYCQQFGEFLKIKIENMTLQHSEATIQNRFRPRIPKQTKRKKYGIVTVANGDGIIKAFKEFGADVVIKGGQTFNPSTQEFISAFNETNADNIFVLPNNNNIILTAKQAAEMYKSSNVYVVETKSIGDGYAALSMVDFTPDNAKEIIENMNAEIVNTITGAVTKATRTTICNNVQVNKDDYIGVNGKNILTDSDVKVRAITNLIDQLQPESKDCGVIIYGKSMSSSEKNFVKEYIANKYNNLEIYEIDGKQDIYDIYIILN